MRAALSLILILLVQTVPLSGLMAISSHDALCADPACCRVIEKLSCCDEPVIEVVCDESGGECHCILAPADSSPKRPTAPNLQHELRVSFLTSPQADQTGLARELTSDQSVSTPGAKCWRVHRTHNQVQALLGIWRT